MDVDNDTDLDLFVAEHNGLEPYGLNFLWENQVETDMNSGETSHVFEAFGEDVYGLDYLNSHVVASGTWTETAGWICGAQRGQPQGTHLDEWGLRQRLFQRHPWASRHCVQPDAAGAKLTVHSPSASQSRILHVGENYLSQESEYEVFGLGEDTVMTPSQLFGLRFG